MKDRVITILNMVLKKGFSDGFQKLYKRYQRCVVSGGDYFEG